MLRVGTGRGRRGRGTVSSGPTDPYWPNVVLLAGFSGADGAATYTEVSSHARVATFFGNAQISGNALSLDGTGDYITFPASTDWDLDFLAGQPWTLEIDFICPTLPTSTTTAYLVGQWDSSVAGRAWSIFKNNSDRLDFQWSADGTASASITIQSTVSTSLVAGQRYRVCVEWDGAALRTYLDGTFKAKSTTLAGTTLFHSTLALSVGTRSNPGNYWLGSLDEIRITKGVARYASDAGYTPTAFLTA